MGFHRFTLVHVSPLHWGVLGTLILPGMGFLLEPLPNWDASPHPCDRPCAANESPKTCEYHFMVEWFLTLSKACHNCPFNVSHCSLPHCVAADGQRRAIISTNRKMPGPAIQVCEGDNINVHVTNGLGNGEGITIHWHGIHQRATPYMDGTNMVTQCPVTQGSIFKYEFVADPAGTHFWHSHTGFQRADGLQGPFIVRSPPEHNPHYGLYDHDCDTPSRDCEHLVMLTDWLDQSANARYVYTMHYFYDDFLPLSALMNGKGQKLDVPHFPDSIQVEKTPWEVFDVAPNKRYRFRVINSASMTCPFKVAVVGHQVTVIAADGHPVQPVLVDAFLITPGERYDFILTTNQTVNNYWMQALGGGECAFTRADVFGIVRYNGASQDEPPTDRMQDNTGMLLNPVSSLSDLGANVTLIHQLKSTDRRSYINERVDVRLYIGIDFNTNDNTQFNHRDFYPVESLPAGMEHYTPTINNITFLLPPSPILSQRGDLDPSSLCNHETVDSDKCLRELCLCTHIEKVSLGQVVELVIVNEGRVPFSTGHPMHIHGYNFRIISSGKLGDSIAKSEVRRRWESGSLPISLDSPSYRDTVWVPDGGYVVARLKADNPGYWFFHCHVVSHAEQGQGLILQVGDPSDLPPVPLGFPRCGNWAPDTRQTAPVACDCSPGAAKSTALFNPEYSIVLTIMLTLLIHL